MSSESAKNAVVVVSEASTLSDLYNPESCHDPTGDVRTQHVAGGIFYYLNLMLIACAPSATSALKTARIVLCLSLLSQFVSCEFDENGEGSSVYRKMVDGTTYGTSIVEPHHHRLCLAQIYTIADSLFSAFNLLPCLKLTYQLVHLRYRMNECLFSQSVEMKTSLTEAYSQVQRANGENEDTKSDGERRIDLIAECDRFIAFLNTQNDTQSGWVYYKELCLAYFQTILNWAQETSGGNRLDFELVSTTFSMFASVNCDLLTLKDCVPRFVFLDLETFPDNNKSLKLPVFKDNVYGQVRKVPMINLKERHEQENKQLDFTVAFHSVNNESNEEHDAVLLQMSATSKGTDCLSIVTSTGLLEYHRQELMDDNELNPECGCPEKFMCSGVNGGRNSKPCEAFVIFSSAAVFRNKRSIVFEHELHTCDTSMPKENAMKSIRRHYTRILRMAMLQPGFDLLTIKRELSRENIRLNLPIWISIVFDGKETMGKKYKQWIWDSVLGKGWTSDRPLMCSLQSMHSTIVFLSDVLSIQLAQAVQEQQKQAKDIENLKATKADKSFVEQLVTPIKDMVNRHSDLWNERQQLQTTPTTSTPAADEDEDDRAGAHAAPMNTAPSQDQ